MRGQEYEAENICAECEGPLRAGDNHFHSRAGSGYYGAEPICCNCVPDSICQDKPLAQSDRNTLMFQQAERATPTRKGARTNGGNHKNKQQEIHNSREEQDVSKTSQKNAKVAKVMKGQAEAKAGKTTKKKEITEFKFVALSPTYVGTIQGRQEATGKVYDIVHQTKAGGETECGYDTQVLSSGAERLGVNWIKSEKAVTCGRCIRIMNKEKKPTPIAKAKKGAAPKAKAAKKEKVASGQ